MLINKIIVKYFILVIVAGSIAEKLPPNVIVFYADDLGWADVGYHSNHTLTPNIDTLAADGIVLDNYYTQPLCSPSRGALLTGVHPIHTGLQTSVLINGQPVGLPLHFKLWPQYLKNRYNYVTHIVGKWHLGYASREYLPTYRGFDSHVGCWVMGQDYYHHTNCWPDKNNCALDMHHNLDTIYDSNGTYSTHYYTDRCINIINEHNTSQPLFLYIPYSAVHSGGYHMKLDAPQQYTQKFAYIESNVRQVLAAMAYAMDESIGRVVSALHHKHNMLQNSILIFASDNGGDPLQDKGNGGSNRPLRGTKFGLFEGGIRVPALIWSPLLNKSGYVSDAMIHVTDLLPTILDAIDGTEINDQEHLYGISQWKTLSNNERPVRREIIHNIDPYWNMTGIRWYNWKLVQTPQPFSNREGKFRDGLPYVDHPGHLKLQDDAFESLQSSERQNSRTYQVLTEMGRHPDYSVLKQPTIECGEELKIIDQDTINNCQTKLCLFNMMVDPCERKDLIDETDPEFIHFLWNRLVNFNLTSVRPLAYTRVDHRSDPLLYNNTIINWLDYVDDSKQPDNTLSSYRSDL